MRSHTSPEGEPTGPAPGTEPAPGTGRAPTPVPVPVVAPAPHAAPATEDQTTPAPAAPPPDSIWQQLSNVLGATRQLLLHPLEAPARLAEEQTAAESLMLGGVHCALLVLIGPMNQHGDFSFGKYFLDVVVLLCGMTTLVVSLFVLRRAVAQQQESPVARDFLLAGCFALPVAAGALAAWALSLVPLGGAVAPALLAAGKVFGIGALWTSLGSVGRLETGRALCVAAVALGISSLVFSLSVGVGPLL